MTDKPAVTWTRKQTHPGTEFRARDGRVVVEKIELAQFGFRRRVRPPEGWVIKVDGEQVGAAHNTAKKAMEWAELPGVYNRIAGVIEANDRAKRQTK